MGSGREKGGGGKSLLDSSPRFKLFLVTSQATHMFLVHILSGVYVQLSLELKNNQWGCSVGLQSFLRDSDWLEHLEAGFY